MEPSRGHHRVERGRLTRERAARRLKPSSGDGSAPLRAPWQGAAHRQLVPIRGRRVERLDEREYHGGTSKRRRHHPRHRLRAERRSSPWLRAQVAHLEYPGARADRPRVGRAVVQRRRADVLSVCMDERCTRQRLQGGAARASGRQAGPPACTLVIAWEALRPKFDASTKLREQKAQSLMAASIDRTIPPECAAAAAISPRPRACAPTWLVGPGASE